MSDTNELSQQALDHFIELLEKKEFKKTLIKSINEDIDIPFINEKTEKKAIDALYGLIVRSLKNIEMESLIKKDD